MCGVEDSFDFMSGIRRYEESVSAVYGQGQEATGQPLTISIQSKVKQRTRTISSSRVTRNGISNFTLLLDGKTLDDCSSAVAPSWTRGLCEDMQRKIVAPGPNSLSQEVALKAESIIAQTLRVSASSTGSPVPIPVCVIEGVVVVRWLVLLLTLEL